MTKKERIELLIQAYEDNIESYTFLEADFRMKIAELRDTIHELRRRKTDAQNEIQALRLMLTYPDGPWTSSLESREDYRRQRQGWFVDAVLEAG